MKDAPGDPYPGSNATVAQVIALADEYRRSAQSLFENGRAGKPLSWAPARLCCIHAVELYLNAFRLHDGESPEKIRSYLHDFSALADTAIAGKLRLRKRTAAHLIRMAENREYLVARYGPEVATTQSQINRLQATLDEIAGKVKTHVDDRHLH